MLILRLRRWPNIKTTSNQRLVLFGVLALRQSRYNILFNTGWW